MKEKPLDEITIDSLRAECIIGVNEYERNSPQPVIITVCLFADLIKACKQDDLDDTIDYSVLTERIKTTVAGSSFYLIERLAEQVAELSLQHPKVKRVHVTLRKPNALPDADSAAVTIVRSKIHR